MIRTENLVKIYSEYNVETLSLNNINIAVERGEFVSFFGPMGSGKTSLFNILGLLDTPTSGSVKIDGTEVSALSDQQRTVFRRDNLGFVFQNFNLIEELSVYENIELPLIYMDINRSDRKKRVETYLERFKLGHRRKNYPAQLPGVLKQRVAIARAAVIYPKLILADEPTGNLNSKDSTEILDLLAELNSDGITIILMTCSLSDANKAHRILEIFDGKEVSENYNYV